MDSCLIDLKDLCCMATRVPQEITLREYTDWAENQVIKGNDSKNVLILASLGLDRVLDGDDVLKYFSAYLQEIGISIPEKDEMDYYYVRRAFKKVAFANTEKDLWYELSAYFSSWYLEFDNSSINKVIKYWHDVHDDFIYRCIDDYPYCVNIRHCDIPKEKHADYVRALAVRFYRLFSSEYSIFFVKTPGKLMPLRY